MVQVTLQSAAKLWGAVDFYNAKSIVVSVPVAFTTYYVGEVSDCADACISYGIGYQTEGVKIYAAVAGAFRAQYLIVCR